MRQNIRSTILFDVVVSLSIFLAALCAHAQSSGGVDLSFNPGFGVEEAPLFSAQVESIAVQSDDKILIGGTFTIIDSLGLETSGVARLNTDGTLDGSFDAGTGANGTVRFIVVQSDGQILIAGSFTSFNGTNRNQIARLNMDGTLDTDFDPGAGPNDAVHAIAVQTDGKVLLAGAFTRVNGASRFRIARLNSDGTLDDTFDPGLGANNTVTAIAVQPDERILVGGTFTTIGGIFRGRIARLNANGTLDNSFNAGMGPGGTDPAISLLVLQADGRTLIAGRFTSVQGIIRRGIARLNANGALDGGFNPGAGADGDIAAIAVQPDGKVLIGGAFTTFNTASRNGIARLNAGGSLDGSFNPGTGANGTVHSIALQPDENILIGGSFTTVNAVERGGVARLLGTPAPSMTVQPISQAATLGGVAVFVAAVLGDPPPTLQWQSSTDGETWSDLTNDGIHLGATTSILTVRNVTSAMNRNQFRVMASNSSGAVASNPAILTVTHPNRFRDVRGIYSGLFFEPDVVRHESAGFATLKLAQNGVVSGALFLEGGRHAFRGRFDVDGLATSTIPRRGLTPLVLELATDVDESPDEITGTITDGMWVADLAMDRATFHARTNPAPQAGRYTLVFPGDPDNAATVPAGDGIATVIVNAAGSVLMRGVLADGAPVAQRARLSRDGLWPLFAAPYRGRGLLLSWVPLAAVPEAFAAEFSWIKTPAVGGRYFPAGIEHAGTLAGSPYLRPADRTAPVIDLSNGALTLSAGNLPEPIEATVSLITRNAFVISGSASPIVLRLNPANGMVRGRFVHSGTARRTALRAIVLQSNNSIRGFFLGTDRSGMIRIAEPGPAPDPAEQAILMELHKELWRPDIEHGTYPPFPPIPH